MPPSLDPTTFEVLAWAKRAALARNRSRLGIAEVLCGLYALDREGHLAKDVRALLSPPDGEPRWPDDLKSLYDDAQRVTPTEERFPFETDLKAVIDRTFLEDRALGPEPFVRNLKQQGSPLVARLAEAGDEGRGGVVVARLDAVAQRTRRLKERLARRVLGQEPAIAMLADAYYRACIGGSGGGPRGIFTFLGPPGVGKTLLAECFAEELAAVEPGAWAFRRFDMGSFSGHQAHEQLFGAAAFYSGAQPGTLTGFVKEHPRCVLLFDEIEKGHDNTILALLAVLDKGEVEDKKLDAVVSFREAWCVFTTNLGREFFGSSNQSGILESAGQPSPIVFEILSSARRAREVGQEGAQPALPLEFVSRLAKGGAVVFGVLETRHFMQLVEQTLTAQVTAGTQASGIPLPDVTGDGPARLLFLMSLLPGLDARQVVARTSQWAVSLIKNSFEELKEPIAASAPERYGIRVACGADATAFLEERFGRSPSRVLFIDDDAHLPPIIERECAEFRPEVHRVATVAEALDELRRFQPDVALLDLSIGEALGSAEVGNALRILAVVRRADPGLPVYLFSENPHERRAFDKVVERVLRSGGARGFLAVKRPDQNPLALEDFAGRMKEILLELRYEKVMREEKRAHRAAFFETAFRWDAEAAVVAAALTQPRSEVVYRATDQASPIHFGGIPQERLSDVVGLPRARRRLAQVLEWLRDPSQLGRFGIRPPRGFLLAGPPGTGKTLLARAVAGEAGLPFLALSAGELQSKWVGESEARIRELFDRAREYAPSIVFIDEIDGIGRQRSGHEMQHTYSILNQLLACLDGFVSPARPVFVLAATNVPEEIDPALMRPGRFDEILPADLPNAQARGEFFARRLKAVPLAEEVDVSRLVAGTSGATPADLDRIVREAVYAAAAAHRATVTADDLENARRLVRFGAEKEEMVVSPEELRRTAYHEAGHCVVHLALFPSRKVDHLTIVANERGALGFLATEAEEDRHDILRSEVEARMAVALGGREAERLLAGGEARLLTSGAQSDLETATALAWQAITRWGFDDRFGAVALGALPDSERGGFAPAARERLEQWIRAAEGKAAEVLGERRDLLDRVAALLLERESLDWDDLKEVVGASGSDRRQTSAGAPASGDPT